MFILLNKKNEVLRTSENRMALRRIKRKLPKGDSLRILEGDTTAKALKAEEKALKEEAAKKEAAKKAPKKAVKKTVKKEVKKETKKVAKKEVAKPAAKKVAEKEVKKVITQTAVSTPSKVEANGDKDETLFDN